MQAFGQKNGAYGLIWAVLAYFIIIKCRCNYSAPPMGMSNRLTVVLQQELH